MADATAVISLLGYAHLCAVLELVKDGHFTAVDGMARVEKLADILEFKCTHSRAECIAMMTNCEEEARMLAVLAGL